MNINQNIAECIVKASDFLSTTTTNICTGETFVVEHGSADVALMVFVLSLLFFVCVVMVGLFVVMFRDRY